MSESKTPRTLGLYKNWLFDKAGTPYFAAYRGDLMSIAYGIGRLESDLAAAHEEIERLRKDTERLDYLQNLTDENGECWLQHVRTHDGSPAYQICTSYDDEEPDRHVDIRAAIDAAMKGEV